MATTPPSKGAISSTVNPARLSENELIAVLDGRSAAASGQEALKEISRRRSGRMTTVMTRMVADPEQPADLRATAAVELGKQTKASHRQALTEALRSTEPAVVRRAAEALGRIGGEAELEELGRLRPRKGAVKDSVAFARTLISYRLGLDRYRLEQPDERSLLQVQPEAALSLRVRSVPPAELAELGARLERELPALPVSAEGAVRFACGENHFLIVFPREIHRRKTLGALGKRSAVLVVVLKRSQVSRDHYVYEYVLSHPSVDKRLRLFGVRSSGVLTRYGEAEVQPDRITASLQTVINPYSPPVDLRVTYEHEARRTHFATALVQPETVAAQKRARGPRKLVPPPGRS